MPHLMPEAWLALAGIAVIAIWAVFGVLGFVEGCFRASHEIKAHREWERSVLRQNIHALVELLSIQEDSVVHDALMYSIEKHRSLQC